MSESHLETLGLDAEVINKLQVVISSDQVSADTIQNLLPNYVGVPASATIHGSKVEVDAPTIHKIFIGKWNRELSDQSHGKLYYRDPLEGYYVISVNLSPHRTVIIFKRVKRDTHDHSPPVPDGRPDAVYVGNGTVTHFVAGQGEGRWETGPKHGHGYGYGHDGLLPSISQTRSAGINQPNNNHFNDVVDIGKFPVTQKIERISAIQVWGRDRVEGIQITYVLWGSPTPHVILHGHNDGQAHQPFTMNNRQFLVGVYGERNAANNVGSISFVVFQEDNRRVEVFGPYGAPPQPGPAYGTFGRVIAFAGTEESAFGLCALSMVKTDPIGGPFLP